MIIQKLLRTNRKRLLPKARNQSEVNHLTSFVSSRQQEYHDLSHQLTFGPQLKPQGLSMVDAAGCWFEMFEVRKKPSLFAIRTDDLCR